MILEINFICFEKNVLKRMLRRIQVKFSHWRRSFSLCTKTYERSGDVSVVFMHQWVSSSVWNRWGRRALEEHSQLETCCLRVCVVEKTSLSDRQVLRGKYTTAKSPIEFENTVWKPPNSWLILKYFTVFKNVFLLETECHLVKLYRGF